MFSAHLKQQQNCELYYYHFPLNKVTSSSFFLSFHLKCGYWTQPPKCESNSHFLYCLPHTVLICEWINKHIGNDILWAVVIFVIFLYIVFA